MRRLCLSLFLATTLLAGCASDPRAPGGARLAFAPERPTVAEADEPLVIMLRPDQISPSIGGLAGRTLRVSRVSDIRLGPKEVVLTFDDGPIPGRTDEVLRVLDRFGVKATFLMVGQMARAYPEIARRVAARGHSVGTHTQGHPNLAGMSHSAALAQIEQGRASVAAALAPSGMRPAPFFRFPYLASTSALQASLAAQGIVVIDADIDSKDYFKTGPDAVRTRTMARVNARGSGIILLHDLHARTATMLPGLLADLKAQGYKVVHLAPGTSGPLVASLDE